MTAMARLAMRSRLASGRRQDRPVSQGVALCMAMLRSGMVGAQLGLLAALLGSALLAGPVAGANAAISAALVVLFCASGQAVQMVATEMANGTAMVLVMTSFLLRAVLLGALLLLAMRHQEQLADVFHRGPFMAGALAALFGWLGGIFVAQARQKVYVYDSDYDAARRAGGTR